MACIKCNRSILSDENHYIASDFGPEILFIIEQDMAHEIAADAAICEACFNSVANLLESTHSSTEVIQDSTIESVSGYETNECVWCLVPLPTRRTHYLISGPQRDAISNIIAPRQIPDGGLVCHRCWTRACRLVDASASNSGQSQHICVWCRVSLSRRRTHIISHGPERDEITAQIAPRQILPGDRVCYACWVAARRNVQRATNPHLNTSNVCIVCSTSTVRRRTHLLLNGPVRDIISRRIHPRQITDHPLVCNDCWTWAQDAVHQANEQPNREEPEQVLDMHHSIQLNSYKKIEIEPDLDNSCVDVADIPPHHSESDSEVGVPLMTFKTEVEEEQEVTQKKRTAREATRATVAKKPKLETLKTKQEDAITAEQTKNEKLNTQDIRITPIGASNRGTYFIEPYKFDKRNFNQVKKNIHHTPQIGKKHKCGICQCSFSHKGNLTKHIRIHTGEKPYKCDICQQSFTVKSRLNRHIRIHTGEKPYNCDVCQRSFSEKSSLTKHIRTHTGEKPYKCDVCQQNFRARSSLTRHFLIHTGEKPYKCNVCQRSFREKVHFTKHLNIH